MGASIAQACFSSPGPEILARANNIKLVFFDIDGTLLNSDGQVLPSVKAAIQRIKAKGIKTAIASGRPYFAARFLVDELGIDDAGMFYTGAHLFAPRTQETLLTTALPQQHALRLANRVIELGLYCEVYTPEHFYVAEHSAISRVHAKHLRVAPELAEPCSVIEQHCLAKLLIGVNRREQGDQISVLEAQFPELIFARAYLSAYPDWQFASVISGDATKPKMFDYLLRYHQLQAHQVMSFGDAESDMDFLRMAGLGIAMGNAGAEVKAAANWVTRSADDAGVAVALNQLFL